MKSSLTAIMFLFYGALPVNGEEQTIPLKQIWAQGMPGTRDVRELEKGTPPKQPLLSDQIAGTLQFIPKGKTTGKAFAVAGTGSDALREASAVLVDGKKPRASFPASSDVSIVFFSHAFGYYVHLRKVAQEPGKIVITYRFGPHRTKEMTSHFALIPLDKLSPGKVKVVFVREPIDPQLAVGGFKEPNASAATEVIAQPFEFEIVGSEK